MAGRNPQSHAKRARELAVKERRERKREKKAEAAAQREASGETLAGEGGGDGSPSAGAQDEPTKTTAAEGADERLSS